MWSNFVDRLNIEFSLVGSHRSEWLLRFNCRSSSNLIVVHWFENRLRDLGYFDSLLSAGQRVRYILHLADYLDQLLKVDPIVHGHLVEQASKAPFVNHV